MKRIAIAAAAALLVLGNAQAQQQSPVHGEVGYTFLKFKSAGFDANPQAARGIIAYDFHPNFSAEGMVLFGTDADKWNGGWAELRHGYGVFVKTKANFYNVEVFARIGGFRTDVRFEHLGISAVDSDTDLAWGLGVNYQLNRSTHIGIDYMRYNRQDGEKIDGWTIGVGYRF